MLIEGPKACGKTATATQVAKTIFRFDEDESARMAVRLAPERLFSQPTPILFDEWQIEPDIWNPGPPPDRRPAGARAVHPDRLGDTER